MCTAATYFTEDFYFGRTLDNDLSYGEEVVVTPRNFGFHFRCVGEMKRHYALIGMAHVEEECPLYYEAVNEKGLGMAGLNFAGNAVYREDKPDRDNVAAHEFIPWILGQCATVEEAKKLLARVNLTEAAFRPGLLPARLHWMIADRSGAVTVEAVEEGLRIYENPAGVLTNNPSFDRQLFQLNNYMHLSPRDPENLFSSRLDLKTYCKGMGALGLPGDLSSQSRFVRAAFVRMNSVSGRSESESVGQFFHILGSVEQQRGCCIVEEDGNLDTSSTQSASSRGEVRYEITVYTCCCNADKGIYYYTTYGNRQITAVDMHREDLEGSRLAKYPLVLEEQICRQN